MKDTFLMLKKPLPEIHRRIYDHFFSQTSAAGFETTFVVGASARDLIFEFAYEAASDRRTYDLDFSVAVASWAEYEELKSLLIQSGQISPDPRNYQRLWFHDSDPVMKVDLVPFGGLENPDGKIAFPPDSDLIMSTTGLKEASRNLVNIDAGDGFVIRTVTPVALTMLKFVSYTDRPFVRQKDVQDIAFIAANYLDAGNLERLYDSDCDLLQEDTFDMRFCGARLLGRDLAAVIPSGMESLLRRLIGNEPATRQYEQFASVLTHRKFDFEQARENVDRLFAELWQGLKERIPENA